MSLWSLLGYQIIEYFSINFLLNKRRNIFVYLIFKVNKSTKFLVLIFNLFVCPSLFKFSCALVYWKVLNRERYSCKISIEFLLIGQISYSKVKSVGSIKISYMDNSSFIINSSNKVLTVKKSIHICYCFTSIRYNNRSLNKSFSFLKSNGYILFRSLGNILIFKNFLLWFTHIVFRKTIRCRKWEIRNFLTLNFNSLNFNNTNWSIHWLNGNYFILYEFWEEFLKESQNSSNYWVNILCSYLFCQKLFSLILKKDFKYLWSYFIRSICSTKFRDLLFCQYFLLLFPILFILKYYLCVFSTHF